MATTMTRWHPLADFGDMRTRLDRLFGEAMGPPGEALGIWSPAIDVSKDDGHLVVRADVPGMKPEEIKVEVEDDVLTISGEHEETKEEKDKEYLRRERRYGSFRRSISLPREIDPEQIEARSNDGVLELRIPLPAQKAKSRVQITPKTG